MHNSDKDIIQLDTCNECWLTYLQSKNTESSENHRSWEIRKSSCRVPKFAFGDVWSQTCKEEHVYSPHFTANQHADIDYASVRNMRIKVRNLIKCFPSNFKPVESLQNMNNKW